MSCTDFDPALTGDAQVLQLDDWRVVPLQIGRWHRPAGRGDRWLLDRCHGHTLDLGCGPGRLVAALVTRGIPVLGLDNSAVAIAHCRARGAPAVHGDLFEALPDEGRWHTVLLADGNVGIGGDPVRLLRRAGGLLTAGGRLLVETTLSGHELWRGNARLFDRARGHVGHWFPWALLGLPALPAVSAAAGLRVHEVHYDRDRCFADLRPSAEAA
ncbi:class I SAM-dependent methyltransferase [Amycolatopsis ultiminotia]|uniref:Class I SAM-dependent methyltransferase n=1 Tax=Amycolatopsis ultiminotia TaxID=543629 RepID=A0ABP6W9X2_9PSEU